MLLAFVVIVQILVNTLYIALFSRFFAHTVCDLTENKKKGFTSEEKEDEEIIKKFGKYLVHISDLLLTMRNEWF